MVWSGHWSHNDHFALVMYKKLKKHKVLENDAKK